MSSRSKVGRSVSARKNDRASRCLFIFSDGRRCRTPRTGNHPHFCIDHAQKEARARTVETIGKDLAYFFSGDYLSANDLSTALARILPAVVRGDIKPKTARTVAYLAQTLLQSIRLAQHEYINAFDTRGWRKAISNSVNENHDYRFPPKPAPPSPVVAGLQTGAVQAPQPADAAPPQPVEPPSNCHSACPDLVGERSAPSASRMVLRDEESALSSTPVASQSPAPTTNAIAPAPPAASTPPPNNTTPTATPSRQRWGPLVTVFEPGCRLIVDGKPWDSKPL